MNAKIPSPSSPSSTADQLNDSAAGHRNASRDHGPVLPAAGELRRIAVEAAQSAAPALREAFRAEMDIQTKSSAHDLVTAYDCATEETLIQLLREAVPDSQFLGEESGVRGDGRVEWIIDPIDGTSNFAHGFAMFSISIAAAIDHQVIAGVVHDPVGELTFSADDVAAYLQQPDPTYPGATSSEELLHPQPKVTDQGEPRPEEQLNLVTSFPGAEMLAASGDHALRAFGECVATYSSVRRLISGALELCHVAAGWADITAGCQTSPWDVAAGQLILRRAGGRYLPLGSRENRIWDGEEATDQHLAPGYIGLGPGVEAPTAQAIFTDFAR